MMQILSVPSVYRWLITLALVCIVVMLSVTPGVERPGDSLFGWLILNTAKPVQKAMHVAVYAALAFSWMWTLAKVESVTARVVLALVLTIGLGAALEAWQTRIPGRFGTIADVLLNTIGSVVGILVAVALF